MVSHGQTFVLANFFLTFLVQGFLCNEGRAFSLFNVVQFDNEVCTSSVSVTGMSSGTSTRNGTCYTEEECRDRSGRPGGKCASGFGVCCVFIVNSGDVTQNNTYLQNQGFTGPLTTTTPVSYTINKVEPDVCFLRLDFETFNILGPVGIAEVDGGACSVDSFMVTAPGANIPTICGLNTGQHMYIDIGKPAANTAELAFAFTGANMMRTWDIKVTQYKATDPSRPPAGCLQYHRGMSGQIKTFNFDATASTHLANQNYQICVRQEPGFSCIQYTTCTAEENAFSLDDRLAANMAKVDSDCSTSDYVEISASSAQCGQGVLRNRFCGTILNSVTDADTDGVICDCTAPFRVGIVSDAIADDGAANTPASQGICLEYTQVP